MKKLLALLLAAVMVFAFVAGCNKDDAKPNDDVKPGDTTTDPVDPDTGDKYGIKYAEVQELNEVYASEAESLSIIGASGSNTSWQAISNCTEGLLTNDQYGNKVPALAESWTINTEDVTDADGSVNVPGTVYTFNIRKGIQWADINGNALGELTAKDFEKTAEIICDPASASGSTLYFRKIVKGAKAQIDANKPLPDGSTPAPVPYDFSKIGFKATGDYTLVVTLEGPIPYFLDYCGSYMPMYRPMFEQYGLEGYGLDNTKMAYIGAYILKTFEPQSRHIYEPNPLYYDKENVFIQKITQTYNAEAPVLAPEMFLRGEIDSATVGAGIIDEWMTREDTKNIIVPGLPDTTYMYYYGFNYNPQFDAEYEPENWKIAVNNESFRKSLYWGLDRYKAILAREPYDPEMYLSNTITPYTWCNANGADFTEIGDIKAIAERENWAFDETKALEFKTKAMEELKAAGATFPIKVLMPYNPTVSSWESEVQVVKQQLEKLLGTDYIQCELLAGPTTGFLTEIRRSGKFAFMKLNNGATNHDPTAWIPAFAEGNNWTFFDLSEDAATAAFRTEYYGIIEDAKVTYEPTERYTKFAKAEAMLIDHAYVIPYCTDTTGYYVTRTNPFVGVYGTDGRYKGKKVFAEPMTTEQFKAVYADWVKEREASWAK